MRILITGSGGQVGIELIRKLLADDHEVRSTDVIERPDGVDESVPWLYLDVVDRHAVEAMLREFQPELVYHLAAILSAKGEKMPHKAYEVNQTGTYNVFEAARRIHVPRVMFASTIAAFGPDLPDPVPNDAPMLPTTMYGITKVSGELLALYYRKKWKVDIRSVRFPGLINAGLPGGGTSDYALFMYVDGVRRGEYESFCREDTRIPMMYMPDAIRALDELSKAPLESVKRCIYNIQGFSPTALEIAESVRGAIPGVKLTFNVDPDHQAILDSWPRALDDSLATKEWGWKPEYDLEAMTADLVPRVREMIERGLIPAE